MNKHQNRNRGTDIENNQMVARWKWVEEERYR